MTLNFSLTNLIIVVSVHGKVKGKPLKRFVFFLDVLRITPLLSRIAWLVQFLPGSIFISFMNPLSGESWNWRMPVLGEGLSEPGIWIMLLLGIGLSPFIFYLTRSKHKVDSFLFIYVFITCQ